MSDPLALCPCRSSRTLEGCCGPLLMRRVHQSIYPTPDLMSAELGGYRLRIMHNRIVARPPNEHIHDFVVGNLRWNLGEAWWEEQEALPADDRHVVMRWIQRRMEFMQGLDPGLTRNDRVHPTGDVAELTSLASDLYYVDLVTDLPDFLIDRLRSYDHFQGAMHELEAAASLVRAGFAIEWIKGPKALKHHDFDATHRATQETIAIEAKSRHRPGVLHHPGNLPSFDVVKADIFRLYRDALEQRPASVPFGIFIDINLPNQSHRSAGDQDWQRDLWRKLAEAGQSLFGPEPPNFVAINNSGWHYQGQSGAGLGQFAMLVPPNPSNPLKDQRTLMEVSRGLSLFRAFPEEA